MMIRKAPIYTLFLSIALLAISCSKSTINNPEDIGKQVYAIVKSMPDLDVAQFQAKLMTFEEVKALEEYNPDGFKANLAEVTKKDIDQANVRNFERFKNFAASDTIDWKKVSYGKFTYKIEERDGFKLCEGLLELEQGEKPIKIKAQSIFNGVSYVLAEIRPTNN